MKKFLIPILISGIISGCSTIKLTNTHLELGHYGEAYAVSILDPTYLQERGNVKQKAMDETGGARSDKFLESLRRSLQVRIKYFDGDTLPGYKKTLKVWKNAEEDGLISPNQHDALKKELATLIENSAIKNPSIIEDDEIKKFMATYGVSDITVAEKGLNTLIKSGESSAEKYLEFYKIFRGKNEDLAQRAGTNLKIATEKILSRETSKKTFDDLAPSFEYIELSKDRSLDKKLQSKLASISLSRENIKRIAPIFPEFSNEQIRNRTIKIDIKANGDEIFAGEISDALLKKNDWIEIDHESTRKINLNRVRISEQRNSSANLTQTVANPDFSIILFIPRNASVLFDYTTTDYNLQWSLIAQDSLTKKSKAINGNRRLKKTECRNIRYQNVFGGTGSIGNYPNSQVQSFCTENANIDFDAEREKIIGDIASAINHELFSQEK